MTSRVNSITPVATTPHAMRFWLLWAAASAIGGAITGYLESNGYEFAATLILQGFIVGAAHWLVLRTILPQAWRWLIATGVGVIIGFLISMTIPLLDSSATWLAVQTGMWEVFWLNALTMPIVILVMALAQVLLLRRVLDWRRWLSISLAAGIALGMGAAVAGWLTQADAPGWLNMWLVRSIAPMTVGWTLYGLLTGWVLPRALRTQPLAQQRTEATTSSKQPPHHIAV